MSLPGPLSVEDLVKQKKGYKAAFSKPKFLSKAERQKLALERRRQEVKDATGRPGPSPVIARPEATRRLEENGNISNGTSGSQRVQKETPVRKDDRNNKFQFEWKASDDTLNTDDVLYRYSAGTGKSPKGTFKESQSIVGNGFEQRKRLLEQSSAAKRSRIDYDDIPWREKSLDQMKDRDWRIFKEDFQIVTKGGGDLARPLRSWEESSIPKKILDTIGLLGYKEPTPIQRAAIPIALARRDVLGVAETGSGKTASFVIPLLSYIMSLPRLTAENKIDGPYAIVLAPTRELAQQIELETVKFCRPLGFRCVSLVGGHSFEEQVFELDKGAEIIIATPGRLTDCIERKIVVLNQCYYVVMDEADRMVDLGFEESLLKILSALPVNNEKPAELIDTGADEGQGRPKYRQTMMYTATMPLAIERMAQKYLRNPGQVTIGTLGAATDSVDQRVEFVSSLDRRLKRTLEILQSGHFKPPVIVFVNYKKDSDQALKELQKGGWKAVSMHGGKSQEQREHALAQLRSGAAEILVATDVAGRGIDIPNVSLVINLQMPKDIEPYTHRIGRTGRAGKKGVAVTFVDAVEDADVLYDLKLMIQESKISRMPNELRKVSRLVKTSQF